MHRLIRYILAVTFIGAVCVVLPAAQPAQAEYASTPIMGTPRLTGPQIANWYRAVSYWQYRGSVPLDTLAQYFVEEGARYNVRGDIAFAQSILETLWLNFPDYGQVRPSDNNYSGIGACNSCSNGYNFATARLGVRAQIQHLRNFADPNSRAASLPDPPLLRGFDTFFYKGKAPTWEGLNGKWAVPGTTYAQNIISIYNRMLSWNGVAPITTTTTRVTTTTTTTRPPTTTTTPPCPPAAPATPGNAGKGYWLASSDGTVTAYGSAVNYGSLKGKSFKSPVLGITGTPSGLGYWLLASDGTVFPFGDAKTYALVGSARLDRTIVGMAATPSGKGYWLVGSDGSVFTFGDAKSYGSTRGIPLVSPVAGVVAHPSGQGYWLLDNAGRLAGYGAARHFGSLGRLNVTRPIRNMVATRTGNGYWVLARDGGLYAFGDARKYGDFATCRTRQVLALAATANSDGYWISTGEGLVTSFGTARSYVQTQVVGSTPVAIAVVN